jgi:arylsulfatase A-like enzyme
LSQPNVFILAVDSLRADAIFGSHLSTPNIDKYTDAGVAFRQCICTATVTTPSFSSILTGCFPVKHGVKALMGYRLASNVTTMAEAFREAGYHTYAEVTGPLVPETGVLRGFEEGHHRIGYNVPFFGWRNDVLDKIRHFQEPWVFLLHTFEVHRPFRPPPDEKERWDRAGYEAVVSASDEWLDPVFEALGDNCIVAITGDHGEIYPETAWQTRLNRGAGWIRHHIHTKHWWRRLDRKLAPISGGHGFGLDEELVRVPLIIAGPGIRSTTIEQQVRHVDLYPTLADLCGVEVPPGADGRSLRPLMEDGALPEQPAYMSALAGNLVGVRTSHWKLLSRVGRDPVLYDVDGLYGWDGSTRPEGTTNRYDQHREVARELEDFKRRVESAPMAVDSGMTASEEAVVEQHLRALGYL